LYCFGSMSRKLLYWKLMFLYKLFLELILCAYIVLQTKGLFNREKRKGFCNIRFSVPQVKILLLLAYFIIFGIVALVALSVLANNANNLVNDIIRYSVCNLFGYDPNCEDIRRDIEKHVSPGLTCSAFLLLGFLPHVHLLFAIQFEHIKKVVSWIKASRVFSSSGINGSWSFILFKIYCNVLILMNCVTFCIPSWLD